MCSQLSNKPILSRVSSTMCKVKCFVNQRFEGNIILSWLSNVLLLSTVISDKMFYKGCKSRLDFGIDVLPS